MSVNSISLDFRPGLWGGLKRGRLPLGVGLTAREVLADGVTLEDFVGVEETLEWGRFFVNKFFTLGPFALRLPTFAEALVEVPKKSSAGMS